MSMNLGDDFRTYACEKLERNLAQIARCTHLLSAAQVWSRSNEHCNALGNLILHLTGNVGEWILAGVAKQPWQRDRPAEFAQRDPLDTHEILGRLQDVVGRAADVIRGLADAELAEPRRIQGYDVSVLRAVFHVVEHFSWHTGQVAHLTKALLDVDLSLYDERGRLIGAEAGAGP